LHRLVKRGGGGRRNALGQLVDLGAQEVVLRQRGKLKR
jgi:hypothetical protein